MAGGGLWGAGGSRVGGGAALTDDPWRLEGVRGTVSGGKKRVKSAREGHRDGWGPDGECFGAVRA